MSPGLPSEVPFWSALSRLTFKLIQFLLVRHVYSLHETMYFLRLAVWTLQIALFSDFGENSLWFHVHCTFRVQFGDIVRYRQANSISHQISELLRRQLLYNIPYHSASLLDEVPSFSMEEGRKVVNHVKGNWRSIWHYFSKRSFALNHSDWFVDSWHSFTL